MSYSMDLREQAVAFVRGGGSRTEASRIFGASRKTIFHWLRRVDLSPTPSRIRKGKIDKAKLASHVQANPDRLLRERAAEFGVTPSGIWRALRKLRISKKNDSVFSDKSQRKNGISEEPTLLDVEIRFAEHRIF